MKIWSSLLAIAIILSFSGCDDPEEELRCYPKKVNSKAPGLGGVESVISDYIYSDETGYLDHINSSNYQTHYFFWDEDGKMTRLERKNVRTFQKHEYVASYDGELVNRIDEYLMNLDQATHEDLDTILAAYSLLEYDGTNVSSEDVYSLNDTSGVMEFESFVEYDYDLNGNITKLVRWDEPGGDTLEAYTYTYDLQNHPFRFLNLLFERESYVNNILQSTNLLNGDIYTNKLVYTLTSYPEQIETRLGGEFGSLIQEITTIEFLCK